MLYRPNLSSTVNHRPRRVRHQLTPRGKQAAALRALTGAQIWLGVPIRKPTLRDATVMVGCSPTYIRAAATLIAHGDDTLIGRVATGRVPLLKAAGSVKAQVALVRALRTATPQDRAAAVACVLGPEGVLDLAVAVEAAV